jgi:hypothetical protein
VKLWDVSEQPGVCIFKTGNSSILKIQATGCSETSVSYSNLARSVHCRPTIPETRTLVTVLTKAKFSTARCHNANFRLTYVGENAKLIDVTTDGRRVPIVFCIHVTFSQAALSSPATDRVGSAAMSDSAKQLLLRTAERNRGSCDRSANLATIGNQTHQSGQTAEGCSSDMTPCSMVQVV